MSKTTKHQPRPAYAPYPGLRPYNEEESGRFFGRDADASILQDKILAHRLTLLFAATGVGKSSLLRAAVIPQLKSPRGKNLEVVYYNDWISPPLEGLKAEIEKALHSGGSWPQDASQNIDATLSLPDFLEFCTLFTHHPLVIMLDQFEELFRYRKQYHQQTFKPFIDQLTALITATHIPVSLVFSMREDFALELNAFKPKLPTLLFENYYRLERLTAKAARAAVLTPAEQIGFRYEPELLDQLIKDLLSRDLDRDPSSLATDEEAETVEPPYLQIVCSQLWEREQKSADSTFHLSTYTKAGGAKGLLNNYVQGVLKGFSDREKQIASKAFDHLISRRGTKMAHTPPDLAELVGLKEDELGKVLDKLAGQRVLRTQQRAEKTWYELYHDMFSDSIEEWNTQWKNRMRVRRTIIGTAASLTTLAGIYLGVIAYFQANSQHFRLGNGNYDRVEIYTGTSRFPDPFGQQQFIYETTLERIQLEPDKRDSKRDIQNHASLLRELISSQPSSDRFQAYIENGDYCLVSTLIRQVIPESKTAPGCNDKQGADSQAETGTQASSPASSGILPNRGNSTIDAVLNSIDNIRTFWGLELSKQVTQNSGQISRPRPYRYIPETLSQPVGFVAMEWLEQLKQSTLEGDMPNTLGGDPRQLAILLTLLTQDNPSEVFTRQEIAEILYNYSQRDENLSLPRALAEALNIVPSLRSLLSNPNASVQKAATLLLSELNDPTAVDGWISLLTNTKNNPDLGPPPSSILANPQMTVALSNLLSDRSRLQETREYAATMLGNSGTLDAVPVLRTHMKDTTEWASIRAAAALALGQISDIRSAPELLTLATNPQERTEIRLNAIEALTMMAYTDAMPALLARFLDKQEVVEIRATIAVVLVLLGGTQYSDMLLEHLIDRQEHVEVREAIAASLAFPEENKIVPPLLQVFTDPATEKKVKRAIMSTLGSLRDNRAIPALLAYRESMAPYFRDEIDVILASFDDPRTRQILESNAEPALFYSLYSIFPYREIVFTPIAQRNKSTTQWRYVSTPISKYVDNMKDSYIMLGVSWTYGENYLNVLGSHHDKSKLLEAMNTTDPTENRKLLANLATDEGISPTIRAGALSLLSTSEIKDDRHDLRATIQSITALTKHPNPVLRRQALETMASLETGKALLRYTQDPHLTPDMKNTALVRFTDTASRNEVIAELLIIIKDETNPLSTTAYQLLGKHHITEALPLLKEKLHTLEDEYQIWRGIRDQQTQIQNSNDNTALEQWRQQLKEAIPGHASMAQYYGYALASMDIKNAQLALSHELADIRAGAIDAVSKNFTPGELQTLDASLHNIKANEPIFHQAAFQAIDNALLRLEMTTQDEILIQLKNWHDSIKFRPNADPVKQRLEWTIKMIQHYQILDNEFQKKYKLKVTFPKDQLTPM